MGGIRRSSEQRPQLEQLALEADFAGLLPAMLVLVTQRQSRLVPELNEKGVGPFFVTVIVVVEDLDLIADDIRQGDVRRHWPGGMIRPFKVKLPQPRVRWQPFRPQGHGTHGQQGEHRPGLGEKDPEEGGKVVHPEL
jgi:hypothetical protein